MLHSNVVWFVTGCSSGLGKSLSSIIYEAGHCIVATARSIELLSHIPDDPNVLKLTLDVTSKDAIMKSLSAAIERFGRIDVVVNNAGYAVMGDTESIPETDARLQIETLFWGTVFITQEAVRIFREIDPSHQGGMLVQISSIGGLVTFPGSSFYRAGKWALGGFTESFAKELDPNWNIKFMIVTPGDIQTNFASKIHYPSLTTLS